MTSPATVSAGAGTLGQAPGGRRPAKVVVRALIELTKPRIIELLLVTTVPAMLLAQRGVPSLRLILVTLVGGTLAAGSANTINCYIDRDIDAVMKRTSRRPLVVNGHGTIKPWEGLARSRLPEPSQPGQARPAGPGRAIRRIALAGTAALVSGRWLGGFIVAVQALVTLLARRTAVGQAGGHERFPRPPPAAMRQWPPTARPG